MSKQFRYVSIALCIAALALPLAAQKADNLTMREAAFASYSPGRLVMDGTGTPVHPFIVEVRSPRADCVKAVPRRGLADSGREQKDAANAAREKAKMHPSNAPAVLPMKKPAKLRVRLALNAGQNSPLAIWLAAV